MSSHRVYYSNYPSAMDLSSHLETEGSYRLPSPRFYSSIWVPRIPSLRLCCGSPSSRGVRGSSRRQVREDCPGLPQRVLTEERSLWAPRATQEVLRPCPLGSGRPPLSRVLNLFFLLLPALLVGSSRREVETGRETHSFSHAPGHPS